MRRRTNVVPGLLLSGILAVLTLDPGAASAQSAADKAAAEALYDEGKGLLQAKKYPEACKRFEASQKLDPGVGTLLFLGECYELTGRIASAWSTFREAASAAKAAGRADREQIARERAGKLEGNLFQVTLSVGGASTAGLRVMRGDSEVKKEVWGLGVPVDPGAYEIVVTAPGKKPWSTKVEIPPTAGSRTIDVPALEDAPVTEPKPTVTATPPAAPMQPAGMSGGRKAGILVGAAGIVGLGIGGVFGGLAASKFSDAKGVCPNTACGDQAAVDASKQAGSFADVSTALFVAGGAVLAGGVILFLVSPSSTAGPPPNVSWISPMVGQGAAGLRAGSTW